MNKRVVGVDAGSTLTKVVFEEGGVMHYKQFLTSDELAIRRFLHRIPHEELVVTGGRSRIWGESAHAVVIDEFDAVTNGTRFLLKEAGYGSRSYLLVNIGTGTSFFMVLGDSYERILGSGIGGGTFVGLGSRMTDVTSFEELARLAGEGVRRKVDLLVGEIYEEGGPTGLASDLTASNFGKSPSRAEGPGDRLRALTNMIAETLILLSMRISQQTGISDLVFVGNGVAGNDALKEDLGRFEEWLGYNATFPEKAGYAGAIGAYIIGMNSQNGQ